MNKLLLLSLTLITFLSCSKEDSKNLESQVKPQVSQDSKNKDNTLVRNQVFKKYGQITTIKYKPISSPINFKYDVVYYIPTSLRGKKNLNVFVFLHGGGASTSDRAGSLRVARMYASDMKKIADELGVVAIMPSGSGINWGGHMLNYLRDLNTTIRTDLDVNPNGIALSGHSMGGMGITRTAHWLTDQYSFFLPVAAGMDERHQKDINLLPFFNMTYYHLQGLNDHFTVFVERCRKQKIAMEELEARLGKKSGFTLEFYNGSHNYPLRKYTDLIKNLFATKQRNLYQKELHGKFYYRKEVLTDQWSNGNEYFLAPRNTYFWLKAIDFFEEKKVISVDAKIENQDINIKIDDGVKKLRIYLSEKMIDLTSSINIHINGINKFSGVPAIGQDMSSELSKDPGFKYDGYIDLEI